MQDCFRDAARELAECPDVAIIQHESGQWLCFDVVMISSDLSLTCRCHASCSSLFREWDRTFYSPNQQVVRFNVFVLTN